MPKRHIYWKIIIFFIIKVLIIHNSHSHQSLSKSLGLAYIILKTDAVCVVILMSN